MQRKKVVLTGATSFLGRGMARELVKQGHEVVAIVRPNSRNAQGLESVEGLKIVRRDMSDCDGWTKEIRHADWFVHFGWGGIGAEGRANPAIQAKNVQDGMLCLEGALRLGCERFLFSGSQAEYGPCSGRITEETACAPILEYGKGKLEFLRQASTYAADKPIVYLHARIFSVYGEGDHPWALVPSCVRAFCIDQRMELSSCEQKWNFLYLDDAARALIALLDAPDAHRYTVYNVAGTDTRTLREFVEEMHAIAGGGEPCYGERKNAKEAVIGLDPSIERLQKITGWSPKVPFREGIEKLVNLQKEDLR